jgi:REP element-mobilizing transposase RayT
MPDLPEHRLARGWYGRGYLPHFDAGEGVTQSVTFRLADSVPQRTVDAWRDELQGLTDDNRRATLLTRIEEALDNGWGECHLRNPVVAGVVETALLFFDGERYHLHSWVVMPNHVHALFTLSPGRSLSGVVGGWKSFTAKEANKLLSRSGQFWQEDYFDRFIRSEEHLSDAAAYIEHNPVKAGLCVRPEDWPFGSARRRSAHPC